MDAGRTLHVDLRSTVWLPAKLISGFDGQPSVVRAHWAAHVPPAHRVLGFHEPVKRVATEVGAGVPGHRPENTRLALDHQRGRLRRIGREDDVHLRATPGLTGFEPQVDRLFRNPVDDVLSRRALEIVDADAHAAMPARVP